MAKKASPKLPKKKGGALPPMNLKIVLDVPDDVATYYINHVEVAHNKHEFSLAVAKLPTKPSPLKLKVAKETGEIHIEPVLQLLLPPSIMAGLIQALTTQLAKYEAVNGVVTDNSSVTKAGKK